MSSKLILQMSAAGLALVSPAGAQADAFEGTLAEYLALDDDGVRIGDAVFSDFRLLPRQQGASGFRPDFIGVVPLSGESSPGFRFEIMDGATAPDFFELRFAFRVTGVLVDRATLSMATTNVRDDSNGGADTLVDLSATGEEPGSLASLITFVAPNQTGDLSESAEFAPVDDLTVEFDAVIDGGGEGRPGEIVASLGSVSLDLGEFQPAPPRVTDAGLVDASTYFIEFTASPFSDHIVTASSAPGDGFGAPLALTGGTGTTDATGFARVEFDISGFGERRFFRVENATASPIASSFP